MRFASGLAVAISMAMGAEAQLKMPAILSEHMVLQDDAPVPIWGLTAAGAEVTVAFAGQMEHTTADAKGHWMLKLKPMKASQTAANLTVSSTTVGPSASSVTIHDVLVGEVWVAGGQSNMAFGIDSMQAKESVLAKADIPTMRLFNVKHETAAEPIGLRPGEMPGDLIGSWEVCDPKTAKSFSAIGLMFGMELENDLKRPVGIISSNWGGTPIQTWMSLQAFQSVPALSNYVGDYAKALVTHAKVEADPTIEAAFQADWKAWMKNVAPTQDAAMKAWNAAVEAQRTGGPDPGPRPKPSRPEPTNPDPTGLPLGGYRPQSPGVSWNAMYAPMTPFAVKGALWYQGEANVGHYKEYGLLLRTMVADWRRQFGEPDMPFLVVQLPANGKNNPKSDLAHMREAQATVLGVPNTGLAVTFDVGDPGNVHPANKVDVAHRLALIARGKVYGEKVDFTGPVMQSITATRDSMRVRFTGGDGVLKIGQQPWVAADTTPFPTDKLIGFQLAGSDKVFHEANAAIDGDSVVLTAQGVKSPKYVRYAWDESPRANLYDGTGLPAAPFRTDRDQ
jgi:sialate O-acetylesterase